MPHKYRRLRNISTTLFEKMEAVNPASKSSLPVVLDPVAAAMVAQLRQQLEAKDQALQAADAIIHQLKEALRLERIRKYGKPSEKLSDLQLELLDLEPAVSSEEIEGEVERGPLPGSSDNAQSSSAPTEKQQRARRNHPVRNALPADLERVEEIVSCTLEQCTCGQCGGETKVIGYEETEVLG